MAATGEKLDSLRRFGASFGLAERWIDWFSMTMKATEVSMTSAMKACLSASDLQALLCEDLPEPQRSRSLDHLGVCPRCSDVFSRMASSWSLSDAAVGADPAVATR